MKPASLFLQRGLGGVKASVKTGAFSHPAQKARAESGGKTRRRHGKLLFGQKNIPPGGIV